MAEPLLVVGLGNPGPNYASTRHNIGFMVADLIAGRMGEKFKVHKKSGAEVVTGRLAGRPVVLAKPRVYMNESGRQVGPLSKFYSVPPADVVIVHDELDIEVGRLKLKEGGGLAGNNGLRSIKQHLHDDSFVRVRIGVGKPKTKEQGADHVLSHFGKRDREQMAVTIEEAADAVETILNEGADAAMNKFNGR